MSSSSEKFRELLLGIATCLVLVLGTAAPSIAQEQKARPTAGVDNTKMGPYRALAQLSFEAFQKGDNAAAAELARILEKTWDGAEEGGGPQSLIKTNKDLFKQVDTAMDAFIKPVMNYAAKAPNPSAVEEAYKEFLNKLKQVDEPSLPAAISDTTVPALTCVQPELPDMDKVSSKELKAIYARITAYSDCMQHYVEERHAKSNVYISLHKAEADAGDAAAKAANAYYAKLQELEDKKGAKSPLKGAKNDR
jgi:hypothetical protein